MSIRYTAHRRLSTKLLRKKVNNKFETELKNAQINNKISADKSTDLNANFLNIFLLVKSLPPIFFIFTAAADIHFTFTDIIFTFTNIIFTITAHATFKQIKKIAKFFNIYAGLYFANNARKYGIIINCNVLAKKIKYKLMHWSFSIIVLMLIK